MKFIIKRTSQFSNDETPPCPEAHLGECTYAHRRTCKTFNEFDERYAYREGVWLSKGTNHRLYSDGIVRDEGKITRWLIDFNNMSDLLEFASKYDPIIISKSIDVSEEYFEIEIYDDYRE